MYPMIEKAKTGQWLRMVFAVHNLRPKDIQNYLSLSCIQTVYRWMKGINVPSIDHLYALSALTDIPLDMLVVGDKETEERRKIREFCQRLMCYANSIEF